MLRLLPGIDLGRSLVVAGCDGDPVQAAIEGSIPGRERAKDRFSVVSR